MKPAWFLRSRNPRAKHWLSQSRIKTETGSISTWLYFSLKAKFNNNNNACVPQEVESREKCSAKFFYVLQPAQIPFHVWFLRVRHIFENFCCLELVFWNPVTLSISDTAGLAASFWLVGSRPSAWLISDEQVLWYCCQPPPCGDYDCTIKLSGWNSQYEMFSFCFISGDQRECLFSVSWAVSVSAFSWSLLCASFGLRFLLSSGKLVFDSCVQSPVAFWHYGETPVSGIMVVNL